MINTSYNVPQFNRFQAQTNKVGFKGLADPQTPAERVERSLTDYCLDAYKAGKEGKQYSAVLWGSLAKDRISSILRNEGKDMSCNDFAERLDEKTVNDLPSFYDEPSNPQGRHPRH